MSLKLFDLEARTGLRFFAEAFGALLLLFAATFFLREPWLRLPPGSILHTLATLAPIVPVWLILGASVRHYFRIDEYQRQVFLQIISLSTGILFCIHWSYPIAQKVFDLLPSSGIEWPFSAVILIVSAWFSRHRAGQRLKEATHAR